MAYVDLTELSGMGQFTMTDIKRLFKQAEPAFRKLTTVPTEAIKRQQAIARKQAIVERYGGRPSEAERRAKWVGPVVPTVMPRRPVVMPAIPLFKPVTETVRRIKDIVERKVAPMPLRFRQKGIKRKVIRDVRGPGGAKYTATDVKVVAGADPVSEKITGAGAPLTGQALSLKEPDTIVPVTPTRQGVTLVDKPTPVGMPIISIRPIRIEPVPGEPAAVEPPFKIAGMSPIMILLIVGIGLPMLLKKKR